MSRQKQKAKNLKNKTILQIFTGSIAAYKTPELIHMFQARGAKVICCLTNAAKEFVTPLTLRSLSGEQVFGDMFDKEAPYSITHTSLAEKTDLVLVAPASANFIARLAAGFADDLASCLVLSSRKPIVIVPAMNDAMYEHPITCKNIERLKKIGYYFVDPIIGKLACGKEGMGHIAKFDTILSCVEEILIKKSKRK